MTEEKTIRVSASSGYGPAWTLFYTAIFALLFLTGNCACGDGRDYLGEAIDKCQ